MIYNRETDRSRGFGFVTMSTVEEAEKAVELLNGYVSLVSTLSLVLYVIDFSCFVNRGCNSGFAVVDVFAYTI